MSGPRFFVDTPLSPGARITLPETVAHHAIRVLRLSSGAHIVVFNGDGGSWAATLAVEGKRAYAELVEHNPSEVELPGKLTLVQGIPSSDKMDLIIEKATELGATTIAPISAQRSILKLSGSRLERRLRHWHRVAIAACEQCGRNRVPGVHEPTSLDAWMIDHVNMYDAVLLAHPDATTRLADAVRGVPGNGSVAILVGPEGGWSEQELQVAMSRGAQAVCFGPRVLRTETAGLALIAASCALLGWN